MTSETDRKREGEDDKARTEEARLVAKEHAEDLRGVREKLKRKLH